MGPSQKKFELIQNLFWVSLWLGLVLVMAGVSARLITTIWNPVALGLLAVGLLIIASGLLLRWRFGVSKNPPMSWWRRRSTQAGTNAMIASVAVVIILAVINILSLRYAGEIDFTENQIFSLAPQTKEVIRQLPEPLKVLSFTQTPLLEEKTLLERYRQINPDRFQFEFVDPQEQPNLARKYQVLATEKVVLNFSDRTKTIDSPLSETDLTPAIFALVQDLKITAYFTEGHGEVPLAGGQLNLQTAAEALNQLDFTVSPLNLSQQNQVPEDADVLIIPGPKRPFLPPEIKMIQAYLQNGGHLFAMLDPEYDSGLGPVLKEWGITLGNQIVIDVSPAGEQYRLGPPVPLVFEYGNHPISEKFAQGLSFFPFAQAVTVQEKTGREFTNLLVSQEQSWAESDPDNETLEFDPETDLQGPLTLGVAVSQTYEPLGKDSSTEKSDSPPQVSPSTTSESPPSEIKGENPTRLVVIGDSDFATTGLFNQGINGDIFLNSITWLGENQSNLSIRPKPQTERRLGLSGVPRRLLALVAIVFLPLVAFGTAGWVWWKRR